MKQIFKRIGSSKQYEFANVITYKKKWSIFGKNEVRTEAIIYRLVTDSVYKFSWRYLDNGLVCYEADRLESCCSAKKAYEELAVSK